MSSTAGYFGLSRKDRDFRLSRLGGLEMADDSEEDSGRRSLLAGLIAGALAGASVALLLAPKTGRETRTLVREGVTKGRERIAKGVEKIRSRRNSP